MDEKHLKKQIAPKGEEMLSINSALESKHRTYTQSNMYDEMIKQHSLIEELGIPYLKVNYHLHTVKWNPSFLEVTNMLESEMSLFSLEEIGVENRLFTFCVELIRKAIAEEKRQEDEFEEENSLYRIRVIPLLNDATVYLFIEDRSLQKQFENLLTFHHQMEAVSHIAAGVAHELRNPLSVIKGFLQLAQLTNDFQKYYETIMSEINRMNGIIEDFLSVSRKKIDRKWQSPVQIIESLLEIMKAECLLHDVEFYHELSKTSKLVHVNESMFKQVMLNLLRNSIEAFGDTNINRILWVETMIDEDQYIVNVKDNGKGMPESVLKQIGKPFFTTKESGTGIGIPLCKKIIEDHGGTFRIESIYNVGTTVSITLPLQS